MNFQNFSTLRGITYQILKFIDYVLPANFFILFLALIHGCCVQIQDQRIHLKLLQLLTKLTYIVPTLVKLGWAIYGSTIKGEERNPLLLDVHVL